MKMFNDSNSFYYCQQADITNSTQRRHQLIDHRNNHNAINADDRFFWNKQMLSELIDSDVRKLLSLVNIIYVNESQLPVVGRSWLYELACDTVLVWFI